MGVVPDISFPSLYDPEEIGESALDHALDWDQINPVRHRRYSNVDALVPQLVQIFESRSSENSEFLYLKDQLAIAADNRAVTSVSLNEDVRRAERKSREARALEIENRRREAIGEEPIASLDELNDELHSTDQDAEDSAEPIDIGEADEEDDTGPIATADLASEDVLLSEAGNIFVDALLLQEQAYALTAPKDGEQ
jgi:carboxyl-terminal processing protease